MFCRKERCVTLFLCFSIIIFIILFYFHLNLSKRFSLKEELYFNKKRFDRRAEGSGSEIVHVIKSERNIELKKPLAWCEDKLANINLLTTLIICCSHPQHLSLRNAIRETWGQYISSTHSSVLHLVFLIGHTSDPSVQKSLQFETMIHNDVIIDNSFEDSYFNLTLKSLSAFNIFNKRCKEINYLLKIDDDTVINTDNLIKLLQNVSVSSLSSTHFGFVMGKAEEHSLVVRNPFSKWYVNDQVYPDKEYPKFVLGYAYLLDQKAAKNIVKVSLRQKKFIQLEDVFLTGILTQIARVQVVSHSSFYNLKIYNKCFLRNLVAAHYFTSDTDLQETWFQYMLPSDACSNTGIYKYIDPLNVKWLLFLAGFIICIFITACYFQFRIILKRKLISFKHY